MNIVVAVLITGELGITGVQTGQYWPMLMSSGRSCTFEGSSLVAELSQHRCNNWKESRGAVWRLACRQHRLAMASHPNLNLTKKPDETRLTWLLYRSFLGQAPLFLLALLLCWFILPADTSNPPAIPRHHVSSTSDSIVGRLTRIDFAGAFLLGSAILALMLPLELGGSKVPWSSPTIGLLFAAGLVLSALFAATEAWWAREPIFPLLLLRQRDVVASYAVSGCQIAAQIGVSYEVPCNSGQRFADGVHVDDVHCSAIFPSDCSRL